MATHEVSTIPFVDRILAIVDRPQPKITSEQVSKYAEISSLISGLEAQQKSLRAQLLDLRSAGAEQEETSPYLLNFVEQERHTVDWKNQALALAAKVYGLDKVATWQAEVEQAAPVQAITSIRVKPNAAFAAGLTKPAASVRTPLTPGANGEAVRFGD
jgi:hypothetical protein